MLPHLRALFAKAHEDAKDRLRQLSFGSLDPLRQASAGDPADGYPGRLHIQTLKGYFGEILAGVVAENFDPFGEEDWEVPAYLFRFHTVAFQSLEAMNQTGAPPTPLPGRTGDDCLAFRRVDGRIAAALICEAKCTAGHSTTKIAEAHAKSSQPHVFPVDLIQLIAVLEESAGPGAVEWVSALRHLHLERPTSGYERVDQVTYVCGRCPRQSNRWISPESPHRSYTASRRLHVAELHLPDLDQLVGDVYAVEN